MILLVAAEKGGASRRLPPTSVCIWSIAALTSFSWTPTPTIPCVQRTGEVSSTLRDLVRRYQVVIVDAGGRDSREMRSAMSAANRLLVPTRASQASCLR
jgi:hypothetical protein